MEDSRTKATNQCRLCLEALNTTTHIGIDLSSASEVRALVKEMYTIEVFATDQVKSICVPCYKSMITHYKNLSCRRNKKRIVQMNFAIQLKLKSVDAYQENDKNSGQRAQEKVSEKAPEKYSEKAPEKSSEKAPEKASEKAPEKSSEKTSANTPF
uniref:ZAD domain-containing protein n=1 Tax=Anopheles atroparvus TaxID=41427 RepID=A0A182JHF0_ANOAO